MLDLVFPSVCSICEDPLADDCPVCDRCRSDMKFLREFSSCGKCGAPFGFFSDENFEGADAPLPGSEQGHLCGRCLRGGFSFEAARSVVFYEGKVRDMIHEFKYQGRLGLEGFLSSLMIGNFLFPQGGFDLVVPVPMHISKLRMREYNQSAVLAHNLARRIGIECDLLTFKKIRDTRPQIEFRNEDERRRNVRGAFSVTDPGSFKGKSILLVDDVFTTGSTSDECAREILKSGASEVSVFTLSRAKTL